MPATSPEQMHPLFLEAFNKGDIDGLLALYEPDATFVPEPGQTITGKIQIQEVLQSLLALKGRLTIETGEIIRAGSDDLAMIVAHWSLAGSSPEGEPLDLKGNAAEIVRRQPDGSWLYAIDDPWGDQTLKREG